MKPTKEKTSKATRNTFLMQGYILSFATGEYSSSDEMAYIFDSLPDLEKLQKSINQLWENEPGNYHGHLQDKLRNLIENLGGKPITYFASVWTDDFGLGETMFHNNISGEQKEWDAKEEKK